MKATMSMSYRLMKSEINQMNQEMYNLRERVTSGKKVSQPSDDPSVIRPVLSFRSQIQRNEKFQDNISIAQSNMNIYDTKVGQISDSLVKIKDTAIQGVNGSYDQNNKDILADQISQLKSDIQEIANSRVNNKYAFAGFNDLTKPFVSNDQGVIESQGDVRQKELEISPGETIQVNLTGEEFLMGRKDTNGDGYLENSGVNIFQEIKKTELAMRGHEGQIVDASGEALSDSEYLDGDPETGVQRLVDAAGDPIDDDSGDQIAIEHDGQPIYLTELRNVEGETVTIGDLENPESYNLDSSNVPPDPANELTAAALDKAVYIHKNGDIAKYDKDGDPILTDDTGDAVEKSAAAGGGYVSLLESGQPMQKMYVPELTNQLDELDNALNQVSRYRGQMGNNAARVKDASEQLEESVLDIKEALSSYEDADIAKLYSELVQQQTALQAALKVSSRIAQLSMLNYM